MYTYIHHCKNKRVSLTQLRSVSCRQLLNDKGHRRQWNPICLWDVALALTASVSVSDEPQTLFKNFSQLEASFL